MGKRGNLAVVEKIDPSQKPAALRAELLRIKHVAHESGWELARVITRICNAEAWREFANDDNQRFASREAWVKGDLAGVYGPAAVSRICKTMNKIDKLDIERRKPYLRAHFWNVVEALESETEKEALELVTSGKTLSEIRGVVKSRRERKEKGAEGTPNAPTSFDATQHEPFLPLGIPDSMPAPIVGMWEAIKNLERFRLERATPHDISIFESFMTRLSLDGAYVKIWLDGLGPEALTHTTSDGITRTWSPADVAAGKVRCRMCGSWDKTALDPHHVIERSHQCKGCGPEHEVPIVDLCRPCHDSIKRDNSWVAWAEKWGYGELAKQHAGKVVVERPQRDQQRVEKAVRAYLLVKRPLPKDNRGVLSYRTLAVTAYNTAVKEEASTDILAGLRAEYDWAMGCLAQIDPDTHKRLAAVARQFEE